jgi:hypothetical protein
MESSKIILTSLGMSEIVLLIITLAILGGFGFLIYKLFGRKPFRNNKLFNIIIIIVCVYVFMILINGLLSPR